MDKPKPLVTNSWTWSLEKRKGKRDELYAYLKYFHYLNQWEQDFALSVLTESGRITEKQEVIIDRILNKLKVFKV